ncbi:MAG: archaemetzincin family Zn-dependent metalloprotease [Ignavibacteriae bacterium]|nr:archaemetzincin family Zn-dependent metalloprotease [Ignavibacteriota bacterium]
MNSIHLLPLGDVDRGIVESLQQPLSRVFRMPVLLKEANLPLDAFFDEARGQYNSTAMIQFLRNEQSALARLHPGREGSHERILMVFGSDLYIPVLTYVFGEAELGGRVAIVSYYRLRNELYGLPLQRPLLLKRICKEALHELGHTYGLTHCLLQDCVMHASTYVEDIDLKGDTFCPDCIAAVQNPRA